MQHDITAVAIGRNEGERLRRCLESLAGRVAKVVYVDSGSTDGSVELAQSMGAEVVELDLAIPFTAARARNAGLKRVETPLAMVLDGDCELAGGFLDAAQGALLGRPTVAIVCGLRRERFPNATIWNRLCDMEWERPAGEADACGGDALVRMSAVREVGGYREDLIAGEEPEMCLRLRRAGWSIHRTADAMTLHDAAMTSVSQWWKRNVRAGHACAESVSLHDNYRGACLRSIVLWAVVIPAVAFTAAMMPRSVLAAVPGGVATVIGAILAGYAAQIARVAVGRRSNGDTWGHCLAYGTSCVVGKFAQAQGVMVYARNQSAGRRTKLIEYKGVDGSLPSALIPAGVDRAVAYLTTEYPKPSHTFVRRELVELEARGWRVERFSIRPFAGELVDPSDIAEDKRTFCCLRQSTALILWRAVVAAVTRPVRFARATKQTFALYQTSQRSLLRHLAYLAEACLLLPEMKRRAVGHVHVHFGKNAADVALMLRTLGGPTYSMTVHGPGEFDAPGPFALGEKVADSEFTVAISSFGTGQLRRWVAPRHWNKLNVVHCTIGDDFLGEITDVSQSENRFCCVGRLTAQKGQLLLVEAVANLVDAGEDVHLTLAGDGELRADIERLVADRGIGEHVTITGWVGEADVRRLIRDSRALVLPSFAEGLPVALMEAGALGRPVISSYVAGIPELIKNGETGWLVVSGSVPEIESALRSACEATIDELTGMGRALHERVRAEHRTATEVAKLDRLLRKCVGGPETTVEERLPAGMPVAAVAR